MFRSTKVLTIISTIIKWAPIGIYGCFNIETFYSTAEKGITVSAIVLLGAILFYLKDAFKQWFLSPSAFKYVAILWLLSLIFIFLGDKIFEVTSVLLASFLGAVPIDAWKTHVKQETLDDETTKKLKELLNK